MTVPNPEMDRAHLIAANHPTVAARWTPDVPARLATYQTGKAAAIALGHPDPGVDEGLVRQLDTYA